MDEASVIPPIIWQTIEPMTDINTEIIWAVFGNPLHAVGPFRECFGRFAHRWRGRHVDAREVGISDKEQIREWGQDHAEDSYFFMTRVRGQFPTASALQFIPTDLVEAAMTREIVKQPGDPLVLGVDIANSVMTLRSSILGAGLMRARFCRWYFAEFRPTVSKIKF